MHEEKTVRATRSGRPHGRRSRRSVAAILSGAILGVSALALPAQAATTATTFSLTAGLLSISAPTTAALTDVATGAPSISGSLGTVTTTDARGSTAGWTATTTSTSFAGPSTTIANTGVAYTPGLVTAFTGVVLGVPGAGANMGASQTAMAGTVAVGNNTVSWAPSITVTLPSNALAGAYSGTITHSVT